MAAAEGAIVLRRQPNGLAERAATRKRRAPRSIESRPWGDLPEEILEMIILGLGAIDFIMFSRVCKAWREFSVAYRNIIMSRQSPYVILLSTHAKKSCYFYNFFENKMYRTILPNLTGKACFGTTCGFLILVDKDRTLTRMAWKTSQIWLINPFTGEQHIFPPTNEPYCGIVLGRFRPTGEYVLLAYSRIFQYVQYCRTSDRQWITYDFTHKGDWLVMDLVYFRGQIYFLSNYCELGRLRLFCLDDEPLQIVSMNNPPPSPNHFVHLATTSEKILMIDLRTPNSIELHKYSFHWQGWLGTNLTDEALYMGDRKSTGVHQRIRLPGCPDGLNFMYYLAYSRNMCASCFVNGRLRKRIPVTRDDGKPDIPLDVPIWYFPYKAFDMQYYDGYDR